MDIDFFKYMPLKGKQALMQKASKQIVNLINLAQEGHELQEGEEDFGVLVVRANKNDPNSPIAIVVQALDANAQVVRTVKSYLLSDLLKQLNKHL